MKKINRNNIKKMCVSPEATIRQVMEVISEGQLGVTFIVDGVSQSFLGLITDGDIRRALLKGHTLKSKVENIERPEAKVATVKDESSKISRMFSDKVRIIPILDGAARIVDVALFDQRFHLPVAAPFLGEKELEYVTDCILTNWISSTGKYVNQFEKKFADYCGTKYAIATSNGTTALHLALLALGIGKEDEVIVPSLTFIATANAVTYTGAKPVFVDSEEDTWNIDPKKIEAVITSRTKAIIPVHLYGHPADMGPIKRIAKKHHLAVIEDAAEAHGAEYKGKKIGSIGDVGVFSFFGNKIITTGEGGMVVTNSKKLAAKMRILRDHGMDPKQRYWHPVLGYNYRLTNIQAAIGVAQIEKIDSIIERKLIIAQRYTEKLNGIPGLVCPPCEKWAKNVYWLYSILVEKEYGMTRDELVKEMHLEGVDTRPLFIPVHQQPIYAKGKTLEVAEKLSQTGVSLPSSASLKMSEVDHVCEIITRLRGKTFRSR